MTLATPHPPAAPETPATPDGTLLILNYRPRDAPMQAPWRHTAIIAIKLVHSLIFLLNSAAILHIFVVGLRNRPSRWTRTALVLAFTEVAVFLANCRRCPLTDLVEHLGAENGRVSDIFLPRWFADRIPQLCGPLLLIGVLALSWHRAIAPRVPVRRCRHGASCQLTREGRDICQVSADRASSKMKSTRADARA